MGKVIKSKFSEYPVPTLSMPSIILRIASLFDGRITPELLATAGQVSQSFDGSKIERELGFEYLFKDIPEITICDAAQSMIDLNIVEKPKGRHGAAFYMTTTLAICGLAGGAYYYYHRYVKK